ncbi:restriction endonuclease subunit S [Salinicola sp. MIT1003]|uniref:restriction endonuclease subunit S n=1 Tax=Salinicola sp. MIT1003 TaxID=1882734 RepID=UPI0008DC842F|nr:restriction endonuclease subunit S [Salinicola sp. MIT1003]OHY98772.1 hypothetical protein BC443_07180 [Salinicola sp. MIT1003]
MSFPQYPEYKDSGVEWLGEVPAHWGIQPLKRHCDVMPSNVDKKSVEGEQSVLLCNYTDVYYHDDIVQGMSFMQATASGSQIEKFPLLAGDVIFTKDSESSDDIAIAAHVPETLPGVVCGYHLSIARPHPSIIGLFLKHYFDSRSAKSYFAVSANGLTRVGLSQYASDNLPTPLPPIEEQATIAAFLDHETARIDALVEEQQRLIELLKEKRQAVISHAVTKGLDPDVPMKDSGVEWLGEVPAHWVVAPIKMFFNFLDGKRIPLKSEDRGGRQGEFPYYGASGVIDWIDGFIFDKDHVLVSEDGANLLARSSPIAFVAKGRYWVNNHAHILEPIDANLEYWAEVIENLDLSIHVTGSAQPKLTSEALGSIAVASPPSSDERLKIKEKITGADKVTKELIKEAVDGIKLLQERRSALISAAVTGKIDVRGWKPPAGSPAPTETTQTEAV